MMEKWYMNLSCIAMARACPLLSYDQNSDNKSKVFRVYWYWLTWWGKLAAASLSEETLLGIQNVRTEDAATNMARRGAHFKQEATPM